MGKQAVLALDSLTSRIDSYVISPHSFLHPLMKAYVKLVLINVDLWQSTDPQPLYRNEFHELIFNTVCDVWQDMSPFNWSDTLLHNHAENTADWLTAVIYGG